MKLKSPIVVLVAGAALAVGLIAANMSVFDADSANVVASVPVPSAPITSTPPSPSSSPSTSPSASGSASPSASSVQVTPSVAAVATYAGKVTGGGSLSIVVKATSVIAYLCDGTNESWLGGTVDGSTLTARNKAGDTLTGTRGGGKVVGSITVDGTTWTYSTPLVKKPSGLYRATAEIRGASVVGGWIVLPDGTQVGVLRRDEVAEPAPAIDPANGAVTIDGTLVTATEPDPVQLTAG